MKRGGRDLDNFTFCLSHPSLPPLLPSYNLSILLFTFTDTRDEIDDKAEIGTHIQDYLAYLKSGATLHDETDGMQVGAIVTVASYKKNAKVPWFEKVTNIDTDYVDVIWLHRCKNTIKYYYTDSSVNRIHFDTIICNGVEFAPKFGDKLVWKLLTPLLFLYTLHQSPEQITINKPISSSLFSQPKEQICRDISSLTFTNKQEFEDFVSIYDMPIN
jgi:hypothetical protein